ncbi:ComEC/Rec2 family competence protein [Paenibacillus montanisoli]|uniref:Competence protein ComEC n=1 Tax=Paenibacillus montanisoli TaxID=2081970 RepID=A0A328U988_9BACL|nr:ComEC/Rec2 family competence protein [Paenibacillus montanisoli]RAP76754.1 competence protein ComEC [Paenibacillus montanisoli]
MLGRRPLIWFTVCWVLGGSLAASLTGGGAALSGAALLAAMAGLALLRRASWPLAVACIAAYWIAAGQRMWVDSHNVTALTDLRNDGSAAFEAELRGTIVAPAEIDGDQVRFRVAADAVKLVGEHGSRQLNGERMQVQVKLAAQAELAEVSAWRRGSKVVLSGELSAPAAATNFGGFDYRRYLRSQRIHWQFGAEGAAAVRTSAGSRWTAASMLGFVDAARAALGERMDRLYPDLQSGYMKGLVLGITDDLDPTVYRQFAQLGLTHILAISGLHVAVFLYALGGLLRLARLTRERMLLLLIAAVPLYVLLAGASPSVVRAGIMAMLGLAAARLHKLGDGLHLLAAAALAMLAADPYMLGNVGFQLSFLVTAGLILGAAPVRGCLPAGRHRLTKALLDLLAVTAVAQAVSLPLTIYYFNAIHLLSIPANLVLVPFISFIVMPLGGASLLLASLWQPAGALLAQAAVLGNKLTFAFVNELSGRMSFRLIWATPPIWWVVSIYAALGLGFAMLGRIRNDRRAAEAADQDGDSRNLEDTDLTQPIGRESRGTMIPQGIPFIRIGMASPRRKRQTRNFLTCSAIGLTLLLWWAYHPDFRDRHAYADFIDVGQGDAILIRTPGGKHLLIDGGGAMRFGGKESWRERKDPFEVGRKLLVPLLQQRGVHRIDLLVVSHLDSDHIKGLQAVLETIPVKGVLWNGTMKASGDALTLLRKALNADIPLYRSMPGLIWQPDAHSTIELLGGASEGNHIAQVEEQNGQSVALILQFYNRRFLFAGDADVQQEQLLVEQHRRIANASRMIAAAADANPFVDVMKLSHHGSKTSTSEAWLAYWQPKRAVISVGRTNSYGHPSQDVLSRLTAAKVPVSRTDTDGEVQFRVSPDGSLARRNKIPGF